MTFDRHGSESDRVATMPRIIIPEPPPPTAAELARRRALLERAARFRARIGTIGVRTDELIRQVRDEADGR